MEVVNNKYMLEFNMPTIKYRGVWLCWYYAGHLPCSALLAALCTCLGISLLRRPPVGPIVCLWNVN